MANGTDRKSSATVYIKAPGAKKYTAYTYSNAKKYAFKKAGTYSVYYVVTNKNKTSVKTESKKVTVKVSTPATTTAKPATTEEPATTEKPATTATTELQNTEKESANTASEASTAQ
jgi:PKD repeat protein